MTTAKRYLNGIVEMLGRPRIACRVYALTATGARLELAAQAHLLRTVGLQIADGHSVIPCDVTEADRSRAAVVFKQLDGVQAAAAKRAIRKALDAW